MIPLREVLQVFLRTFQQLFSSIAHSRFRSRETVQSIVQIGIESLPIVVVCTAFAGMV